MKRINRYTFDVGFCVIKAYASSGKDTAVSSVYNLVLHKNTCKTVQCLCDRDKGGFRSRESEGG